MAKDVLVIALSGTPAPLRPGCENTSVLPSFHPAVRDWFTRAFGEPTPAQEKGWPVIAAGRHALLLAPTGSGKTLAAFLWSIHSLLGRDPGGVEVLSPLDRPAEAAGGARRVRPTGWAA